MMHGYWGAVLRILAKHKPTHFAIARDVAHTKMTVSLTLDCINNSFS